MTEIFNTLIMVHFYEAYNLFSVATLSGCYGWLCPAINAIAYGTNTEQMQLCIIAIVKFMSAIRTKREREREGSIQQAKWNRYWDSILRLPHIMQSSQLHCSKRAKLLGISIMSTTSKPSTPMYIQDAVWLFNIFLTF